MMLSCTSFVPPAMVMIWHSHFCSDASSSPSRSLDLSEPCGPVQPIAHLLLGYSTHCQLYSGRSESGARDCNSSIARRCVIRCAWAFISNWVSAASDPHQPVAHPDDSHTETRSASRFFRTPPWEPDMLIPAWVDRSNCSSRFPLSSHDPHHRLDRLPGQWHCQSGSRKKVRRRR